MQTNYDDMPPNYADALRQPIAVWRNTLEAENYGFPLDTELRGVAYPLLKNHAWEFYGVLPVGTPATNITKENGGMVRCTVGGLRIVTDLMVVHN